MQIIHDLDFKTVVSVSKAIQQAQGQHELTISSLLLGSLVADMRNSLAGAPSVRLHTPELRKAAEDVGLDLTRTYAPVEKASMPVAKALKVALADHAEDSFDAFFNVLLGYGASEDGADHAGRPQKADVTGLEDEAYRLIIEVSAAMARHFKMKVLSPELFAVSALVACDRGKLAQRRGLATQIVENRSNIEALSEHAGWIDLSAVSQKKGAVPPVLAPEFQKALNKAAHAPLPLVTLLNAGISVGAGLRMRRRVAYHEAGHAVLSLVLRPELAVTEVTVVPEGDADGVTKYDSDSVWWTPPYSRETVLSSLCVCLAGRASEQGKYGHGAADAGASADLQDATGMAWRAITQWGLDDSFGPVCLDAISGTAGVKSGWLFDEAQRRLQALLNEAQAKTEGLIREHGSTIEAVALKLLERDKISGEAVLEIMQANDSLR